MIGRRRRALVLVAGGAAVVALSALAFLASQGGALGGPRSAPAFPHERHANLFPVCTGCHEGIPTGDMAAAFPAPELCARCHDGDQRKRVDYTVPTLPASNLKFRHPAHAQGLTDTTLACSSCHTEEGAPRMAVRPAVVGNCLSCHAHQATSHFADAECTRCHVPMAQSGFSKEQVVELPRPADHGTGDFLASLHGREAGSNAARCATCHVRQRCTSCHVDAASNPVIGEMPVAPDSMALPAYAAHYPVPPSHETPGWIERHGSQASVQACGTCHVRQRCTSCHVDAASNPVIARIPVAPASMALPAYAARYPVPPSHEKADWIGRHGSQASVQACGTCHTRTGCETCHAGAVPAVVAALPARSETGAPGVELHRTMPRSHSAPTFGTNHAALAGASPGTCTTCHTQRFCTDCHAAAQVSQATPAAAVKPAALRAPARETGRAGFHPSDYIGRHAADAWGRRLECSNCHQVAVFCRDCHVQQGMESVGRLGPGFHDAEPLWLLRHGQAARQGLESCASCHRQRDCLQCHSQVGSFQVNPHGRGFDAALAKKKNPVICYACHVSDPLPGSIP